MSRTAERADCEDTSGLNAGLLVVAAATAAGAFWVSILIWRKLNAGPGVARGSRKILRELDAQRETLRRQLMAGQAELADETRIRIAELQRMIMQFEGFI